MSTRAARCAGERARSAVLPESQKCTGATHAVPGGRRATLPASDQAGEVRGREKRSLGVRRVCGCPASTLSVCRPLSSQQQPSKRGRRSEPAHSTPLAHHTRPLPLLDCSTGSEWTRRRSLDLLEDVHARDSLEQWSGEPLVLARISPSYNAHHAAHTPHAASTQTSLHGRPRS